MQTSSIPLTAFRDVLCRPPRAFLATPLWIHFLPCNFNLQKMTKVGRCHTRTCTACFIIYNQQILQLFHQSKEWTQYELLKWQRSCLPPVTKHGVGCAWEQRTRRSCRAQPVPHSSQSRAAPALLSLGTHSFLAPRSPLSQGSSCTRAAAILWWVSPGRAHWFIYGGGAGAEQQAGYGHTQRKSRRCPVSGCWQTAPEAPQSLASFLSPVSNKGKKQSFLSMT